MFFSYWRRADANEKKQMAHNQWLELHTDKWSYHIFIKKIFDDPWEIFGAFRVCRPSSSLIPVNDPVMVKKMLTWPTLLHEALVIFLFCHFSIVTYIYYSPLILDVASNYTFDCHSSRLWQGSAANNLFQWIWKMSRRVRRPDFYKVYRDITSPPPFFFSCLLASPQISHEWSFVI